MSKAATNRLAGIIATKGDAPRPHDQPQRAAEPVKPISPAPAPAGTGGVKSLTLRLASDEYDRLRHFAFDHRATHQDVLSAALREYLDARA